MLDARTKCFIHLTINNAIFTLSSVGDRSITCFDVIYTTDVGHENYLIYAYPSPISLFWVFLVHAMCIYLCIGHTMSMHNAVNDA